VIGAPMYNYSLPASLKAWIDRISFPGAFVDPDTGTSLLANTEVVVISSRGGAYGPGTPRDGWDYELPYLRAYFTNHGVLDRNIRFITAELALADLVPHLAHLRPQAEDSLTAARTEVRAAARPRVAAGDTGSGAVQSVACGLAEGS